MNPTERAAAFSRAFPDRPPLSAHKNWVTGTWLIGACYKNPNPLYGAYPHGYLERVHAMFPDARNILHVFSGGLTEDDAIHAWRKGTGETKLGGPSPVELVDLHGPEQGRYPTWQGNVMEMPLDWCGRFDLILADPPYSAEDAEKYETPTVDRGATIRELRRFVRPGGNLVWLDQVWPMHRKEHWKCWAQIALVRSTNHRVRLVSMFEAV